MLSDPSAHSNLTVDTPTSSMYSFTAAVSQELGLSLHSVGNFDASRDWVTKELESFLVGLTASPPAASRLPPPPPLMQQQGRPQQQPRRRRTLSDMNCDNNDNDQGQPHHHASPITLAFDGDRSTAAAAAAAASTTTISNAMGFTKRCRFDLG